MSLFKSKRKNQIVSEFDSTTSQSALLPVQNVYSAYNRLPSPVHTFDQDMEDVYSTSNIRSKFHRQHFNNKQQHHHQKPHQINQDRSEKFSQQQKLIKEAEERAAAAAKLHKKPPYYTRLLCCFCFPCLPMWTRTICCFVLLLICGFSCLLLFLTLSFKQPRIVLDGGNDASLNYSIYNGNYFEMYFDKIKAVVGHPRWCILYKRL